MQTITREQLVADYLKKYPDIFTPREKDFILSFLDRFDEHCFVPDLVREVMDEVGVIPDDKNIYIGFLNLLNKQFPVAERRIIEVGGGIIPRLGKRIADIQTTGNIVVYDPRLSRYEEETDKLRLVKSRFDEFQDTKDSDLMIGLMPCEAAEVIIKSATSHQMDFMLGFCEGGPHGDCYDYFEDEDEWLHSMMYYAEREIKANEMGKMKVKYLKEYGDPYPVIYNDRNS